MLAKTPGWPLTDLSDQYSLSGSLILLNTARAVVSKLYAAKRSCHFDRAYSCARPISYRGDSPGCYIFTTRDLRELPVSYTTHNVCCRTLTRASGGLSTAIAKAQSCSWQVPSTPESLHALTKETYHLYPTPPPTYNTQTHSYYWPAVP